MARKVSGGEPSAHERILSLGGMRRRDLDDMHEESTDRFGVGIGVVVQEEARHARNAASHAGERARIESRWQRLWPWSRWHVLRRLERTERARQQEWEHRLKVIAHAVAHRDAER